MKSGYKLAENLSPWHKSGIPSEGPNNHSAGAQGGAASIEQADYPVISGGAAAAPVLSMHWLDRVARKLVLARLEAIEIGTLYVHELFAGGDGAREGLPANDPPVLRFGKPEAASTASSGRGAGDSEIVAHIHVLHPNTYTQVLTSGTIGSGEAYMDGFWTSPDLVQVIRLMVANMSLLDSLDSRWSLAHKLALKVLHRFNANSLKGSRRNISAHYDLGNDFFSLFLDPTMLYSSAVFPNGDACLAEASEFKLAKICRKLRLKSSDHLLEIGTGWGGMAVYAAKHFGCRVTTTTISREQYEYAKAWVEREGLSDRVTLLLKDYRELEGHYDKLVSIEMVEAVGHQYYHTFFSRCSQLLKPDGLMVMQAITIQDQRFESYKNSVDFIQRYIFPGGCLPSNQVVATHIAKDTDMQIVGMDDITFDYARTLRAWREAFFERVEEVRSQGFDQRFINMWDFYLCYCEGGFLERVISTAQFTFAKPRCRTLPR
ncbi:cyclopropane-fatty-acyl-phospholipid synthase family protein [Microbulbifer sp. CAU 1566]|uniref:SAM-dependent methyltransferase n=1 Tax=Microbulbifer sp. CAU 1566 TaxID=2933269 RepID=UPI0020057E34|nr:cyclopropane-fatty-acyl-phospholipid synthase family protein [Microbulbifer sp. CAU 1566]MCK7597023.1 cyclopropane-fatty-acyl-phospholipid synthase family protein [Microbulbifer sp. CAU 1566]